MFLIGLELDLSTFQANIRRSIVIAGSGLIGPFAVSAPVGYLLYTKYGASTASVGNFIFFIMVSMSITAFPVLARILSDHNLFHTRVGITAISAASIDDAVGWCLLALVVAIVSANSALSALWSFLCGVAWVLFMLFFVRRVKLSATHETLSTSLIFLVYFMVLISSWVTEAIGIHAIFGAFILGLVVPHEDGFAIQLTEKTEDFVAILLVPLYFANSGLRTKIGLLDDATAWGMVILVITCACTGKIFGATFASRWLGLSWRESWSVGFLMNTKGLVELIVLNVGLDAGVISEKVFVIMTIMAIFTTLMTSPIITYIYPSKHHVHETGFGGSGEARTMQRTKTTMSIIREVELLSSSNAPAAEASELKVLVCLFEQRSLPGFMSLVQMLDSSKKLLLGDSEKKAPESDLKTGQEESTSVTSPVVSVVALRLIELTDRTSAVMAGIEEQTTILRDPLLNVFRTFAALNKIQCFPAVAIRKPELFGEEIVTYVNEAGTGLVLVPFDAKIEGDGWFEQHQSSKAILASVFAESRATVGAFVDNGFGGFYDSMLGTSATWVNPRDRGDTMIPPASSALNSHTAVDVPDLKKSGVESTTTSGRMTVMVLFFGGADDRSAVGLSIRFLAYPGVSVEIVRVLVDSVTPSGDDTKLWEGIQQGIEKKRFGDFTSNITIKTLTLDAQKQEKLIATVLLQAAQLGKQDLVLCGRGALAHIRKSVPSERQLSAVLSDSDGAALVVSGGGVEGELVAPTPASRVASWISRSMGGPSAHGSASNINTVADHISDVSVFGTIGGELVSATHALPIKPVVHSRTRSQQDSGAGGSGNSLPDPLLVRASVLIVRASFSGDLDEPIQVATNVV
ncbi:K(+)/H(+) antiporter [Gonapodya sp. JEL0774]|nr:K(+)/H(+) antiporter [Gonapodya sp. JEL0774]